MSIGRWPDLHHTRGNESDVGSCGQQRSQVSNRRCGIPIRVPAADPKQLHAMGASDYSLQQGAAIVGHGPIRLPDASLTQGMAVTDGHDPGTLGTQHCNREEIWNVARASR